MQLTKEEEGILNGSQGEVMAKIMQTMVSLGDIFGAKRMVEVTHDGHIVTSMGIPLLKPLYRTMQEIIDAGITAKWKFTADPRPIDYKNVKCNVLDKLVFSKIMYGKQADYEKQLNQVGLKSPNAFSCTCYMPEMGNIPKKGDILSWAESSAVVYANSVLGARCNRNSGMIDLFGCILGKVPEFGLLLDENRQANWVIEIKTKKIPEAQILGSAIGIAVGEGVPYIKGLDKFIGKVLNDTNRSYLKDMGAASASNGAVGLFHVENLTPEAVAEGEKLIRKDAKTLVIDDEYLQKTYDSYPILWKKKNAKPTLCFIGCPHLSMEQLNEWTDKIFDNLIKNGRTKVKCRTILTVAPAIADKFRATSQYLKLQATGAKLSSICPLMYLNNPLTHSRPIITCSNKLRTYTSARYYTEKEILDIITGKED